MKIAKLKDDNGKPADKKKLKTSDGKKNLKIQIGKLAKLLQIVNNAKISLTGEECQNIS